MANPLLVIGTGATRTRREYFRHQFQTRDERSMLRVPYGFCFYAVRDGQKAAIEDFGNFFPSIAWREILTNPAAHLRECEYIMEGPAYLPGRVLEGTEDGVDADMVYSLRRVQRTMQEEMYRRRVRNEAGSRFARMSTSTEHFVLEWEGNWAGWERAIPNGNDYLWTLEDLTKKLVEPMRKELRMMRFRVDVEVAPEVVADYGGVIQIEVD